MQRQVKDSCQRKLTLSRNLHKFCSYWATIELGAEFNRAKHSQFQFWTGRLDAVYFNMIEHHSIIKYIYVQCCICSPQNQTALALHHRLKQGPECHVAFPSPFCRQCWQFSKAWQVPAQNHQLRLVYVSSWSLVVQFRHLTFNVLTVCNLILMYNF